MNVCAREQSVQLCGEGEKMYISKFIYIFGRKQGNEAACKRAGETIGAFRQ